MSNVLELTPQVIELLSHVCNYALKGFGLEAQRFTSHLEMLVSTATAKVEEQLDAAEDSTSTESKTE